MRGIAALAAAAALALSAALPAQEPGFPEKLAGERGCSLCHTQRKSALGDALPYGPTYAEIAARYRGQPGAEQALTRIVIHGSSPKEAHWRSRVSSASMLPNEAETSPDEARALVRWILSLRE